MNSQQIRLVFVITVLMVVGGLLLGTASLSAAEPTATSTFTPTSTSVPGQPAPRATATSQSAPRATATSVTAPRATATAVAPTATKVPPTVTRTPTKVAPTPTKTVLTSRLPLRTAARVGSMRLPGTGWWTGMQVVNTGSTTATVGITLYDMASSSTYASVSKQLASNASYSFSPLNAADWAAQPPAGFVGSGVVSADQPILAIVNEQNNNGTSNIAAGSYDGWGTVDTNQTLYFPLVKYGYGSANKTTNYFVQNAGSSAADVYATFNVAAGTFQHIYTSLGANQMVIIQPVDAGVPTGSTSLGSLIVTSTVPLAGIYNEFQQAVVPATNLAATGGFAPTKADTKLFVPVYKQNYNTAYTGFQVQNTGGSSTTVYVTYTVTAGGSGTFYSNKAASAGQSVTFYNESGWPSGSYGSIVATASQPIVGIVNESKTSTGQAAVYSAFPSTAVKKCAIGPLWKERWNGVSSGQQSALVVQNVSGVSASVVVTFTMTAGGTGVFTTAPLSVAAGASVVYGPGPITGGPPSATPALGSVVVCADQNIAAIVQETTLPGFTLRDLLNYEAFPQ